MTLERRRSTILGGLSEALVGGTKLRGILRYHIGMTDEQGNASHCFGKLLRPSLVLLTTEGLGGDAGEA
ncbi:polyprenyl synthetase family protein, partial [Candidatus Bipolaricaulota bacterium]|nr:polyprenyl synthetase family protein [Candidatus Bipolaricaulota bacterium]